MFLPKVVRGASDCAGKRPKFSFTLGCRQLQQTVVSTIDLRCICSKSAAKTLLQVETIRPPKALGGIDRTVPNPPIACNMISSILSLQ
jgi:hypothetical protein